MSGPYIPPSDYSDEESDRESQRIANAQKGRFWRATPQTGGDPWGLFGKLPGGAKSPPQISSENGQSEEGPYAEETSSGGERNRGLLSQLDRAYSPIPSDYEESRSRHGLGDRPSNRDRDEQRTMERERERESERERERERGGGERGWGQASPNGGRHDDGYESEGRPADFGKRRPDRFDRGGHFRDSGRREGERNRRSDPREMGRDRPSDRRDFGRAEPNRADVERNSPNRADDSRDRRYNPNERGYPPRERELPPPRERAHGPGRPYPGYGPEEHRNRGPGGPRYDPRDRREPGDSHRFTPPDDAFPPRGYSPDRRRFTPQEQASPNRRYTPQDERMRRKTPYDPRIHQPDSSDRYRPDEPRRGSPHGRDEFFSWGRYTPDGPGYGRQERPPSFRSDRDRQPGDRRGYEAPPSDRRGQYMHHHPYPPGRAATRYRPSYPSSPRGETLYQNASPYREQRGPSRPVPRNVPYPERENGYVSDTSSRSRPRDDSYQSDDENSRSSQNDGYEAPTKKPNPPMGFSYAPKESLEKSFSQGNGFPYNPPTPRPGHRTPKSLDAVPENRGRPEGQPSFAEEYNQRPKAHPTEEMQHPEKSDDPKEAEVSFVSMTLARWLLAMGVVSIVVGIFGLFFCITWQAMAGAPLWSGVFVIIAGVLAIMANKRPSKTITMAFLVVTVVALVCQLVNLGITASGLSDAANGIKIMNGDLNALLQASLNPVQRNPVYSEITSVVFVGTVNLAHYVNVALFSLILLTAVVTNVLLVFVLAKTVWQLRQRQEQNGERHISMMNLPQAEHVNPQHEEIRYMDSLS